MKKLITNSILIIIIIVFAAIPCFAAEKFIGSRQTEYSLDMWHYSGSYWRIGNFGGSSFTISDAELKLKGTLTDYLNSEKTEVFSFDVPTGADSWKLSENGFFDPLSVKELEFSEETLRFSAKPVFALTNWDMSKFVGGLNASIPLIDKAKGNNIYAIYGNGKNGTQGDGLFSASSPQSIFTPYIHPSQIKDSSGSFLPRHTIHLGYDDFASDGFSIGDRTFKNAGACGLHFSFPVKVLFYQNVQDEEDGSEGNEGESHEEASFSKVKASLYLTEEAYEGQEVWAQDCSQIIYEGSALSPERAYAEGLASNSFSAPGADSVRPGRTEAALIYNESGTYDVTLTVRSNSGEEDYDTQSVKIKRCPDLTASLSGSLKQNRKETMTLKIAQNPNYPIKSVRLSITERESGETINVTDKDTSPFNSDNIKYRIFKDAGSDECYLTLALEFLTKFDEFRYFDYTAVAVDSRGRSEAKSGSFAISPDEAPKAVIDIESSFIRNKGSRFADIYASDLSETDGDEIERSWFYSENGTDFSEFEFTDLSFGSFQDIKFSKKGVGNFYLKLKVKDDWHGDTLEEYITDADRLSDETTAESCVDNIAPIVSLGLKKMKTAEILLLTDENVDTAALSAELLKSGIDADIYVHSNANDAEYQLYPKLVTTLNSDYGFGGYQTSWEGGTVLCDEYAFYKLTACWIHGGDEYECQASQPFYLTAYDKNDGHELWRFSLSESILKIKNKNSFTLSQDLAEKYIYLGFDSKTIIVNKKNGRLTGILSCSLGSVNYPAESFIYSFLPDGIYKIPSSGSGKLTKIHNTPIYTGDSKIQIISGKILYLTKRGNGLYAGWFDPKSEKISYIPLEKTANDPYGAVTDLLGIGSNGNITAYTSGEKLSALRVFDPKTGDMLYTNTPVYSSNIPVLDTSGNINYYISYNHWTNDTSDYTDFYAYFTCYGIWDNYKQSANFFTSTDYGDKDYYLHVPLLASELDDGSIYLIDTASFNVWRWNNSYNYSYTSKTARFKSPNGKELGAANYDAYIKGNTNTNHVFETAKRNVGTLCLSWDWNAASSNAHSFTDLLTISEKPDARIERLKQRYLSFDKDYSLVETETDAAYILSKLTGEQKGLDIKTEEGGYIKKNLLLSPGKTYYYEYDTDADSDVLEIRTKQNINGSASDGYRVTAVMSEDFDDPDTNDFFSIRSSELSGGKYCIVKRIGGQGNDNNVYTDTGSIEFEIPEGCRGCLSFDYSENLKFDAGYYWFEIKKEGEEAKYWVEGIDKHYTEKTLLTSGKYSLICGLRSFRTNWNRSNYVYIDNLELDLLVPDNNLNSEEIQTLNANSSVSGNHVTGSFTAPLKTINYGKLNGEYISGLNTKYDVYTPMNGYWIGVSDTLTIPAGKTAIYVSYYVNSNPGAYDYQTNLNAVTWSWLGKNYISVPSWMASWAAGTKLVTNIPQQNYQILGRMLSGKQTISASATYGWYGAGASINGFEMILANSKDKPCETIQKGMYFVDNKNLYFKHADFSGDAEIRIRKSCHINNLKIYSIENGAKVYIENGSGAEKFSTKNAVVLNVIYNDEQDETPPLVYEKGEYVEYDINYSDYENDPSKISFYQYVHTPLSDGPAFNGKKESLLNEPLHRFYSDGKYTLRHWQFDSTGNAGFDKQSNIVEITFFIKGEAKGTAPQIKLIETDPKEIAPGNQFSIEVTPWDEEGDELTLEIELYCDYSKIYSGKVSGLHAGFDGNYTPVVFNIPETAKQAVYDVIAIARDNSSAGSGTYRFSVKKFINPADSARLHRVW